MIRTYKYLLRPNRQQEAALDFLLWQSRLVYNAALEQRIQAYKERGETIWARHQWPYFRDLRHANPDTLGKLNVTSLQYLLRRLDTTYVAYFRKIKAGEKTGLPKFKDRRHFRSFEFHYDNGCRLCFAINGHIRLHVQSVGEIRMSYHRPIPEQSIIKHVVIRQKNDRWYVGLILDIPDRKPAPKLESMVGVDVGISSLLALSDGKLVRIPAIYDGAWQSCELQRKAERGKFMSRRRTQAYRRVALLYERISCQRWNNMHQLTRALVNQYSLIAIENFSPGFMHHNRHISQAAIDTGLSIFSELLAYKAEEAGVTIVTVCSAYTSQRCSSCGELVKKDLKVRIHICHHCGLVLDRDVNAARNILQAALAKNHS